jgi:hypothetical protein
MNVISSHLSRTNKGQSASTFTDGTELVDRMVMLQLPFHPWKGSFFFAAVNAEQGELLSV